jgi:hypothetical protein
MSTVPRSAILVVFSLEDMVSWFCGISYQSGEDPVKPHHSINRPCILNVVHEINPRDICGLCARRTVFGLPLSLPTALDFSSRTPYLIIDGAEIEKPEVK